MIIEYSYTNKRLFFGLRNNGDFYFENQPTKKIEIENEDIYIRSHSKLIFVGDNDNQKKYLFNTGFEKTTTELFDLENFSYKIYNTTYYFGREIFAYKISLGELNYADNHKEYFISYLFFEDDTETDHFRNIAMNKFSFSNFELCSLHNSEDTIIKINVHNRISNSFVMNDKIISFYLSGTFFFRIQILDFDLILVNNYIDIDQFNGEWPWGAVVFLKGIHLKNDILLLSYYSYKTNLRIKLGELIDNSSFKEKLVANIDNSEITINPEVLLNDCVKLNEKRVIILSLSTIDETEMFLLLCNFYNEYDNLKIRVYKIKFYKYKMNGEFATGIYNQHLIISSTVANYNETLINDKSRYSIFLILGYINGTDSTIEDISKYISSEDNNSILNFVETLTQNIIIDNNIFGYEALTDRIKLTFIPEEIMFYNKTDLDNPIYQNDFLNKDYIFKENKNKIKNNEYYSFDYQIILKESEYSIFNQYPIKFFNFSSSNDKSEIEEESYFEPQYFYGRINTVKFKLCHPFCKTCYEYGNSNDDQKCMSCLKDYEYDYFNDYPSNCVPYGFFNDKEEQKLIECNETNSNFYINSTNNKTICFKLNYPCPEEYPYFDNKTHECKYYIIISTILTTIPSKLDTIMPTTIYSGLTTIATITSIPTTIYSSIPKAMYITTYKTASTIYISQTTIPKEFIPSSSSLTYTLNNSYLYNKLIKDILKSYPYNGNSVIIEAEDNYVFQITTSENELNSLNGNIENRTNLSIIDLGDCERQLKEEYNINENENLIILKFEKITNISAQKNVQYEIYNPNNVTESLDISICENTTIYLYIPISLNEKTQKLYNDLQNYGYDLFDINDPFYQDICTPYTSENNTDILLSDRKNDFYNDNETGCQANCEYSDYLSNSSFLKCECNVINEEIDIKNPNKFDRLTLVTSFYEILKYSNYKVLKCYNLVFRKKILKNKGSIMVMVYFLFYFNFLFIYIIKGLNPLKIQISKFLFKVEKLGNINNNLFSYNKEDKDMKIKSFSKSNNYKDLRRFKNYEKTKRNNNKNKALKSDKIQRNVNKSKTFKNRVINFINVTNKKITTRNCSKEFIINHCIQIHKNNEPPRKNKKKSKTIINTININLNNFSNLQKNSNDNIKESIEAKTLKKKKYYDDYQLNEMEYNEALQLDKRTFFQMYWSILKREHTIIFLFYLDDYNIPCIKFARVFFLICTDMALNVFFFSDDSMHKIYLDYGKYNFIQQIPQIVYSTIVSQLIQVFISFLSLTDKHVYQIKDLKIKKNEIFHILNCIRIKILGFFLVTSILFIFYWYIISSFCEIYINTQIAFIKDSIISFITGIFYPFILYLFPCILRKIALNDSNKRFKIIYKLSYIIPFF